MINDIPKIMTESLLITIGLEILLAIIIGIKNKRDLINIGLVNIMTNPLLVSISYSINCFYGLKAKHIILIFLEIAVVLVEGSIYKKYLKYHKMNPYLVSTILNASSYFIGLLIHSIWK